MRTRLSLLVIAFSGAALAGCLAMPGRFASTNLEGVTYDEAWQATLEAIRDRFPLAETHKEEGVIKSDYRAESGEPGLERLPRVPGSLLMGEGGFYTYRRKVEARLEGRTGAVELSLRVTKERLDTSVAMRASPAAANQPSFAQERELEAPYGGYGYEGDQAWTKVGTDRLMQDEIFEAIRQKLK